MYAQSISSSRPVNAEAAALTVRAILAAATADEIPVTQLDGASLALLRAADVLTNGAEVERLSDELELHAEMIRRGRYRELVEFDAWAADNRALALAA